MAEQRVDADGLTRLHDGGAAELGETPATAAASTRDAIAAKIPPDGSMTPEQIVALKAPEATMARVRGKVEKLSRQGYAKHAQGAVDEVDKAGERPIRRTSPEAAD